MWGWLGAVLLAVQDPPRCGCEGEAKKLSGSIHVERAKNVVTNFKAAIKMSAYGEAPLGEDGLLRLFVIFGSEVEVEALIHVRTKGAENQGVAKLQKKIPYPLGILLLDLEHGLTCPGKTFNDSFEIDYKIVQARLLKDARNLLATNPGFFGLDPDDFTYELKDVNLLLPGNKLSLYLWVSSECDSGNNPLSELILEWTLDKNGKAEGSKEAE